ncbi:lactonase family protein [Rhodococcus sp. MSC1_016]|jgi:6-phosphogluconolactonase|uniref:lactonase family protein n=1 Tax=Rhodococcus sp. MSC1_016 TaxID=2909266 RepID=UPI00202DD991|nr:beta-propeller fold lactonase family protein [Rhodococcus sp. MSC1_016]
MAIGVAAGVSVGTVISPYAGAALSDDAAGPSYLLVGGTGSSNIGVLRESGGRLIPVGQPVPTDTGTLSITVTPNGRFAYVAHTVSGTIQGFRVGDDGTLERLEGAHLTPGRPIVGAVVSMDGKWLFATVGSVTNDVQTYAIAPSGVLTQVDSVTIPGATSGLSIPVVSPDGRFLFAPSFIGATMDSYAIGFDGRLTRTGSQVPTGDRPALPSVTPNGKFLYITNEGTNDVSGYRIAPDGVLTPIGRFPTKAIPHGMAITPDGRYLYLPQTGGQAVNGFEIRDDGALVPVPGADAPSAPGHFPGRVVLSPDAQRLYVIDTLTTTGTEKVFTYRVKPDGALEATGEPPVDTGVTFSDGATGVFASVGPA